VTVTALSDIANSYLDDLGASGIVRERVAYFLKLYGALVPEATFTDVFIDDLIDEDGDRQYESLWLIGPSLLAECDNVGFDAPADKWDLAAWDRIKLIKFDSRAFDPNNINDGSRLSLEWSNDEGLGGIMKATGANCENLVRILRKFILPKAGATEDIAV
jgi:hypothetical protein